MILKLIFISKLSHYYEYKELIFSLFINAFIYNIYAIYQTKMIKKHKINKLNKGNKVDKII